MDRDRRHCPGCGRPAARCEGSCGRSEDPPRFCTVCGRRLQEVSVMPGWQDARCRDHD